MKNIETKQELVSERDEWEGIINSPDWVVFSRWIKGHIEYLEKQSKEYLRKHEDRKAGEALYASDDWRKTLESVRIRLASLNEKIEQGK